MITSGALFSNENILMFLLSMFLFVIFRVFISLYKKYKEYRRKKIIEKNVNDAFYLLKKQYPNSNYLLTFNSDEDYYEIFYDNIDYHKNKDFNRFVCNLVYHPDLYIEHRYSLIIGYDYFRKIKERMLKEEMEKQIDLLDKIKNEDLNNENCIHD